MPIQLAASTAPSTFHTSFFVPFCEFVCHNRYWYHSANVAKTKHAEAESMMARAVSIWEAHYRGDHRLLFRGIVMKAKLMLNQVRVKRQTPSSCVPLFISISLVKNGSLPVVDMKIVHAAISPSFSTVAQQKKITAAAQLFQEACDMSERLFEDGGSVAAQCRQCLEEIRELQVTYKRSPIDVNWEKRITSGGRSKWRFSLVETRGKVYGPALPWQSFSV